MNMNQLLDKNAANHSAPVKSSSHADGSDDDSLTPGNPNHAGRGQSGRGRARGRGRGGDDRQSHGRGRGRGGSDRDQQNNHQSQRQDNQKQQKRQQIWLRDEESKEAEDGTTEKQINSDSTQSKTQGKPGQKGEQKKDPKKDPKYDEDANRKTLKFVNLEQCMSFSHASTKITQALYEYKNSSPSSLKTYLEAFIKTSLKRGLKLRETVLSMDDAAQKNVKNNINVLSQGIFGYEEFDNKELTISPSAQDYVIYFMVNLLGALSREKKSLLNKSLAFLEIYYTMVDTMFKIEQSNDPGKKNIIQDYGDFEDYHFKWFNDRLKPLNNQTEAIQIYVRMRMGAAKMRSEEQNQSEKQMLEQTIKSYLNDEDKIQFAIHLVNRHHMHSSIPLVRTCEKLADLNMLEQIGLLLGKKSPIEQKDRIQQQKQLIESMLKRSLYKNAKPAETIIKGFDIQLDDFPQLKHIKKENSIRYHLGNYLRKKPDQSDFMGLDRIENLLAGMNTELAMLCEMLMYKGNNMEAKGIFDRNKLTPNDFNFEGGKNKSGIAQQLTQMKYDESKDYPPPKDLFEPCSLPRKDHLRFPVDVQFDFIDSEEKIDKLNNLIGEKYIGVDAEWRPQIHKWHKTEGIALFQIGSEKDVYLIDIPSLKDSPKLDATLGDIFTHKNTTVVGFSFHSDISMFQRYCPTMKFIQNIPRLLDLQELYKQAIPDFKDKGGIGLAAVASNLFVGKKLCKAEQMSNWENRPLRYTQEHYAAMDAWILVELVPRCLKQFKSDKQAKDSVERCMQCIDPQSADKEKSLEDGESQQKSVTSKSKKQDNKNLYQEKAKQTKNQEEKESNAGKKSQKSSVVSAELTTSEPVNSVNNPEQAMSTAVEDGLESDTTLTQSQDEYKIKMEYHEKMYKHYKGLYQKAAAAAKK